MQSDWGPCLTKSDPRWERDKIYEENVLKDGD